MKDYVEVARFFHAEQMEACVAVMQAAGIEARFSNDSITANMSLYAVSEIPAAIVSVPRANLAEARQALFESARREVAQELDPDYPVRTLSTEVLLQMTQRPWAQSEFEVAVAEKLLGERGVEIPEIDYAKTQPRPIPEDVIILPGDRVVSPTLITYGIWTSVFGGLFGIIISYNIAFATEDRPDGTRRYVYNQKSRDKGRVLFGFACFVFLAAIIVLLWGNVLGYAWSMGF